MKNANLTHVNLRESQMLKCTIFVLKLRVENCNFGDVTLLQCKQRYYQLSSGIGTKALSEAMIFLYKC